jgi:hypothetical protein
MLQFARCVITASGRLEWFPHELNDLDSLVRADVIHAFCWFEEASMDGANAFTGPSGQGHRGD